MTHNTELKIEDGTYRDPDGHALTLCVVEELAINKILYEHSVDDGELPDLVSMQATIVFGGFSLCTTHFTQVSDLIRSGMPMGEIVHLMMTEGLPEL